MVIAQTACGGIELVDAYRSGHKNRAVDLCDGAHILVDHAVERNFGETARRTVEEEKTTVEGSEPHVVAVVAQSRLDMITAGRTAEAIIERNPTVGIEHIHASTIGADPNQTILIDCHACSGAVRQR